MARGRDRRRSRGAQEPRAFGPNWLSRPQPIVRLECLRILMPLAILGFLSSRIVHADHWISDAGFVVPNLGGDWRQPLYLPPVPAWAAWLVSAVVVVSGVMVSLGVATRVMALVFAACLFYLALADRLAAFTVSKLAPVLALALFFSPAGSRFGLGAWWRARKDPTRPRPTTVSGGYVRFFQVLLVVFYMSSGLCKARGDWLRHTYVLWTHLHDSYQTSVSHLLANALPAWSWTLFQGGTLVFEALAPLWFFWGRSRPVALGYGLAMHALIGLMFGPVIWFSTLMMALLLASFAPARWLDRTIGRLPG
jgi:uncharacterized membrane protein YphA (DoxX/SURF4 family)